MPLYYFHIFKNGEHRSDSDGLDLADDAEAWEEATSSCGEIIRTLDGKMLPGWEWRMDVTNSAGKLIHRMRFIAESFK
jgi:hypothetical protein